MHCQDLVHFKFSTLCFQTHVFRQEPIKVEVLCIHITLAPLMVYVLLRPFHILAVQRVDVRVRAIDGNAFVAEVLKMIESDKRELKFG